MTEEMPVLYSFRRCPYAMRARMGLMVSGRRCEIREILLRDKPQEMLSVSAKGTVPVLILGDGTVIDESLDILLWALQLNDPEDWLKPAHEGVDDMLSMIGNIDGPFKAHLDRYKYPTRFGGEDPRLHRDWGLEYLQQLDARLMHHAFLFGDRRSLADVAIFPFIRQFANTDREWFDGLPLQSLQSWLSRLMDSTLFAAVMKKYPVWRAGAAPVYFPDSASS